MPLVSFLIYGHAVLIVAIVIGPLALDWGWSRRRGRTRATARETGLPGQHHVDDAAVAGDRLMALLSDAQSGNPAVAVEAVRHIGNHPGTFSAALVSMCWRASAPALEVRLASLWAIRVICHENPALAEVCWNDANPSVRRAVICSFDSGHACAVGRGGDGARAGATIVESARRDADPFVRREAYARLRHLGQPRAQQAAIAALEDSDDDVVRAACEVLGDVCDIGDLPRLIDALAKASDPRVQMILSAIAPVARRSPASLLSLALAGVQLDLRVAAIRALGASGVPSSAVMLLPLLSDESTDIRRGAAGAIAEIVRLIGTQAVAADIVAALIAQLEQETSASTMLATIDALEACGDRRALDVLLKRLPQMNPGIGERAVEVMVALQRLDQPAVSDFASSPYSR